MFYMGAHISVGAPLLGNMEVPSFLRAFEIKRYVYQEMYTCPVNGSLSFSLSLSLSP
jgi:hypothetical protein